MGLLTSLLMMGAIVCSTMLISNLGDSGFFALSANDIDGNLFQFSNLKDCKATIIFNSASAWGLTKVNYTQITALHNEFKDQGLCVLDFPSNTFQQEPKTNAEIKTWVPATFGSTFQLMEKTFVNDVASRGEVTCPVFKWLKANSADMNGGDIQWNYAKFLVDRHGAVVRHLTPKEEPNTLRDDIVSSLTDDSRLLQKPQP